MENSCRCWDAVFLYPPLDELILSITKTFQESIRRSSLHRSAALRSPKIPSYSSAKNSILQEKEKDNENLVLGDFSPAWRPGRSCPFLNPGTTSLWNFLWPGGQRHVSVKFQTKEPREVNDSLDACKRFFGPASRLGYNVSFWGSSPRNLSITPNIRTPRADHEPLGCWDERISGLGQILLISCVLIWPSPGDPEDPDSFPKTLGEVLSLAVAKSLWPKERRIRDP
jgi:hypothetical protein